MVANHQEVESPKVYNFGGEIPVTKTDNLNPRANDSAIFVQRQFKINEFAKSHSDEEHNNQN